jgi:hypothetical protein
MDCTPSLDGLTDVVSTVHWRYKGTTEDGITSEIYGIISVGQPNPSNFVDYNNLTFQQVSSWLESIYSQEIPLEEGQTEIKETQAAAEENKKNKNKIKAKQDADLIKVLNKLVFYLFLGFIIFLNFFCLCILPYFLKESLSLDSN